MTEDIVCNSEEEMEYRSVRFCLSDELLVEVSNQMEADMRMDLDQISKLALEKFMESEGYIKLEVQ